MRTVHETEVLRPSDPVPRNHSTFPTNRLQRLRLVFTNSSAHAAKGSPITPSEQGLASQIEDGATPTREHEKKGTIYDASLYERIPPSGSRRHPSAKWAFPPDVDFTTAEANLRLDQLFRLLRRQRAWAEAEGEKLSREVADLEEQRHREWVYKELVLENVLEAECSVAEKRAARKRQRKSIDGVEGDMNIRRAIRETALKATSLAIDGDLPWWRREPLLGVEADRIDRDNGGRGGGTDDEIEGATEEPLSMPAKSVEVA